MYGFWICLYRFGHFQTAAGIFRRLLLFQMQPEWSLSLRALSDGFVFLIDEFPESVSFERVYLQTDAVSRLDYRFQACFRQTGV